MVKLLMTLKVMAIHSRAIDSQLNYLNDLDGNFTVNIMMVN